MNKSVEKLIESFERLRRMQNLKRLSTSGNILFVRFSKSCNLINRFVSATAAKKCIVVLSETMPDGVSKPTRPFGATIL